MPGLRTSAGIFRSQLRKLLIREKQTYVSAPAFLPGPIKLCGEQPLPEKEGAVKLEAEHIVHPFPPLYDSEARILILGSLPSVKSREQMFFYGHPQNRFWPLMAALFNEPVPRGIDEKAALVLRHHIALWDSIYSCDITGSSDSSIRNVTPTDLKPILAGSRIERIFCNGRTSWNCYHRFQEKELGLEAILLPSTSPANAAWTMEKLQAAWQVILDDPGQKSCGQRENVAE